MKYWRASLRGDIRGQTHTCACASYCLNSQLARDRAAKAKQITCIVYDVVWCGGLDCMGCWRRGR